MATSTLNINTNGCDMTKATTAYPGHEAFSEAFSEADMCNKLARTTSYGGGYMYTGQHVTVNGEDLGAALRHTVRYYDTTDIEDCKAWAWKLMQEVKVNGSGELYIVTDNSSGIDHNPYKWNPEKELWEQGVVEFFERSRVSA